MFHPWLASSWRNLQVFGMLIYVYINKEPLLLNNICQNFTMNIINQIYKNIISYFPC